MGTTTHTLDLTIIGLDQGWPESLFVLRHDPTGRYGCYCHQGVYGLAVFGSRAAAVRFAERTCLSGMRIQMVSFDEAREIAKSRPMPVVSMMLIDNLATPQIHYIR